MVNLLCFERVFLSSSFRFHEKAPRGQAGGASRSFSL
jgi:hypothetical protein